MLSKLPKVRQIAEGSASYRSFWNSRRVIFFTEWILQNLLSKDSAEAPAEGTFVLTLISWAAFMSVTNLYALCCLPCTSAIRRSSPCLTDYLNRFPSACNLQFWWSWSAEIFITGTLSFIIYEYATMSFRKRYRVTCFEIPMSFWAFDSWTMWFPLKKISAAPSPLGTHFAGAGSRDILTSGFLAFTFTAVSENCIGSQAAPHCIVHLKFWREMARIILT